MRRCLLRLCQGAKPPAVVGAGGAARFPLTRDNDDADDFVPLEEPAAAATDELLNAPDTAGVVRHAGLEDKPYSRLGIPIDFRPTVVPSEGSDRGKLDIEKLPADADPAEALFEELEREPKDDGTGRIHLGLDALYDDPKFAEQLLEMEASGAIDEAWQDGNKASLEDVQAIAAVLREMKCTDVAAVDVSGKTSSFDYIMFATCAASRHLGLAAWAVSESDKLARLSKPKRQRTDDLWEVVPVGRILVNLMVESYRDQMKLERKWAVSENMDPLDAARGVVSEGRMARVHGLWALTVNLQDLEDFEADYCKDMLLSQM